MKELLKYEEFKNEVKNEVKKLYGSDAKVQIHKVIKNNSQEYDGLTILQSGSICSPNIYLKQYYERYKMGESFKSIIESMVRIYDEASNSLDERSCDLSYENCCDKITFRLISMEKNKKILETTPYIPFLDMAVVFYCVVAVDDEGIASVRINNSIMEEWGLNTKQLYCIAQVNTIKLFPKKIYRLDDILQELLCSIKGYSQKREENGYLTQEGVCPYVITNTKGINGAGVIIYPGVLKETAEVLGGNFYLMPSSIHEVIVMKDDGSYKDKEMEKIVKEANQTCVIPEEVLSEHVYYYSEELDRLEICCQ